MDTAALLKKVRKIEIKTKGLSNHIFSGEYHSAFKGRGMSFSEVRDYQFGDDVRNIDWNVTARTGNAHVKVFEEERELTVILLIDTSRSSFFGTVRQMKNELATEISAVLSFSAIQNNDKVGVIFFSDTIEKYIPPQKGRQHILRIIRELLYLNPKSGGTDLGKALEYFNNVVKKRSICFILSDFMTQSYEAPLRIAAKKHDIVGMHLMDPREESLPNVGLIQVTDSETGAVQWIDTAQDTTRKKYFNWFTANHQYFRSVFLKSGADIITISTHEPYEKTLHQFFKQRAK
ncbi:MAG: DUF58 domain-containing protein [Saprospiraceae bacterium]|nr:DUF58 domain-containing protein [Saprospiraceae bacterium]